MAKHKFDRFYTNLRLSTWPDYLYNGRKLPAHLGGSTVLFCRLSILADFEFSEDANVDARNETVSDVIRLKTLVYCDITRKVRTQLSDTWQFTDRSGPVNSITYVTFWFA